jgi:type II secretory pathway component PulM
MWNSRFLSFWQDRFRVLNPREQAAVTLALMTVVFFLMVQFIYFPISDRLVQFETSIKSNEKDLSELKSIISQYNNLKANRTSGDSKRVESLNLFSILEKMAANSGLMEKIEYMRPGAAQLDALNEEKWVEVKLNRIDLKELTDYLYNLQSFEGNIYIKRLSIRKEGERLNLILQPAVIEKR